MSRSPKGRAVLSYSWFLGRASAPVYAGIWYSPQVILLRTVWYYEYEYPYSQVQYCKECSSHSDIAGKIQNMHPAIQISTLAGAPFQAMKANYLIGVFVCLLKIEGSR